MRRLAALLIAIALVLTGASAVPCPDGSCATVQARSMACCQQDGLTRPSCCDEPAQIGRTVPVGAPERALDLGTTHAGIHAPALAPTEVALVAPAASRSTRERARAQAPPDTLVARHTSLLL